MKSEIRNTYLNKISYLLLSRWTWQDTILSILSTLERGLEKESNIFIEEELDVSITWTVMVV